MNIVTKDIINIKAGTSLSAVLGSVKECLSVKTLAYTARYTNPRPDVERYSVEIDPRKCRITITAVPKAAERAMR